MDIQLDFSAPIAKETHDFTGREWVFAELDRWLEQPHSSRFFLLTGAPGSGKSAIGARLVQFSGGAVPPPSGCAALSRGFLSAFHFCSAREHSRYLPARFAESLALQLAARYPVYAEALAELSGDRQIQIQVEQQIGAVTGGKITGVAIQYLEVGVAAPENTFTRVVRQPLEVLLRAEPNVRVVILVDALDEALVYSDTINIVNLLARNTSLPDNVRFICTSRSDERVENAFPQAEGLFISSSSFNDRNRCDIRAYIARRFACDERLAGQVQAITANQEAGLGATITEKADGNFLYACFLLDAIADGRRRTEELDGLPEDLDDLYYESLDRVVRLGQGIWQDAYGPLLGVLSVAQASLTVDQLAAFTGQSISTVWSNLGNLRQFLREDQDPSGGDQLSSAQVYRLYHQSVVDFLRLRQLTVGGHKRRNGYYLAAEEWHNRIANFYWARYYPNWSGCDLYGLHNLANHLSHGRQTDRLLNLISKEWMQARYEGSYHTYGDFLADVEMAWAVACQTTPSADQLIDLVRLRAVQQLAQQDVSCY